MNMTLFVENLEREREGLDATINYLRGRLGISRPKGADEAKPHGRKWSAADRAKMSRLIKARLAAKRRAAEAQSKGAKRAAASRKPKATAKGSA